MRQSEKMAKSLIKRPPPLGDEVYNAIYARLMSLKIPPGGRISIDSLARDLGVSQTPVREALSRLEEQGLVVKTHLMGYSAADQMAVERFDQLYELRLLLEPVAAARAAANMSKESKKALAKLSQSIEPGSKMSLTAYGHFARKDQEFHELIAQGSGNELIRECLARLHIHVHLFRLFYHAHTAQAAFDEHQTIVTAIIAGDSEASADAMREHIERSRERFRPAFDSGTTDLPLLLP